MATYKKLTDIQSVIKSPDVWAGYNPGTIECDLILVKNSTNENQDKTASFMSKIKCPMLFLKLFDEIIVNALDQYTNSPDSSKTIHITYNSQEITVLNKGSFVPCVINQEYNVYTPHMIFFMMFSGANFETKNKITGGKNGIGAKLTAIFSKIFSIEIADPVNNLIYKQHSTNNMSIISEPTLTKNNKKLNYVKISFIPDYEKLELIDDDYTNEIMHDLVFTRSIYAGVCTKCNIFFNDEKININLDKLASLIIPYCDKTNKFATTLKHPENSIYDWQIVIVVGNDIKKFSVSFVNGIHTINGGSHVKFLLNIIGNELSPSLSKIFKKNITAREITKHIAIFLVSTIPDPSYKSQSKVELDKPNKFDYEIPTSFIQKLKKPITDVFDDKHKDTPEKKTRVDFRSIDKFTDALKAGTKERAKCCLFIPEGDSAEQFVNIGIRNKETNLGVHLYGVFNIQGKPINVRKQVSHRKSKNGEMLMIKTQTLKDNERINSLIKVIGLDEKKKYEFNKEGDEEFSKLRYGCIIVAVDQDVDGVGHIFGLILNLFDLFWPNLIRRGFIKRFATPLLMAYPHKGKKVLTFYSAAEYNKWKEEHYFGKEPTNYNVQYFKGLAGHENKTIISFFKKFDERIYKYNLDENSIDLFNIYFGKETLSRKSELRLPIVPYVPVANTILCSQQLQCETKEYQLADITRSLPHIMDGQRPASRIAIEGSRKYFTAKKEKAKLSNLASSIAGSLCYEHGPASLEETIKKMNQAFPGACNLPLFIARSQFGSRDDGGKATAASRYIFTELNRELTDYLFPAEDDPLLPRRSEDGKLCEPKYFVPIIPLSILENFKIPGTGWQANIQARDFNTVIENVKIMIENYSDISSEREMYKLINYMPYWNLHSKCLIKEKGKKILMRGIYTIKNNIVQITDLPPGIWPKTWKETMFDRMSKNNKYNIITNIINTSTDFDINIDVHFIDKESIEKINSETDDDITGIEKFLGIYIRESNELNFVGTDDLIYEAKGYDEILYQWFIARKNLFIARIKRELIILKWKIKVHDNIIKYVDKCEFYKVKEKNLETINEILTKENYQAININHLNNCDEIPTEELENFFISGSNYNYLIDLRDRDKLKESIQKRNKTKKELENKIVDISREEYGFLGSHIWMNEIEKIQNYINSCINSRNWSPNDREFMFE